jgi:hypothetical protein
LLNEHFAAGFSEFHWLVHRICSMFTVQDGTTEELVPITALYSLLKDTSFMDFLEEDPNLPLSPGPG